MFFPWLPIKDLTSQLPAIHMAGKLISKYCTAMSILRGFLRLMFMGAMSVNGKSLFVTRGIGTVGAPARLARLRRLR